MNNEYTMQELIALLECKSVKGKVSLDDIAQIVFDTKFPERLSQNALEKLIEYSNDYKRFKELGEIILEKSQEVLEYQKQVIELNDKSYINDEEEDKIVNEIIELTMKQKEIKDEIKPFEVEFNKLQSYFKKVQQQ